MMISKAPRTESSMMMTFRLSATEGEVKQTASRVNERVDRLNSETAFDPVGAVFVYFILFYGHRNS